MDMNRPQMYMAGLIVLLLGLQLRMIESIVLTENATRFLAEKIEGVEYASSSQQSIFSFQTPVARKTVTPPKWLGWSLLSIGGVMVLHSLAMRKT
jgi:hypothetical protein